jgi:hypothetical protein
MGAKGEAVRTKKRRKSAPANEQSSWTRVEGDAGVDWMSYEELVERSRSRQSSAVDSPGKRWARSFYDIGKDAEQVKDEQALERAGSRLYKRAQSRPDDVFLIGAARVVWATLTMLRVRDDHARQALSDLERQCIAYKRAREDAHHRFFTKGIEDALRIHKIPTGRKAFMRWAEQQPKDSTSPVPAPDEPKGRFNPMCSDWPIVELPPRQRMDRHIALLGLRGIADLAKEFRKPANAAKLLVEHAARLFPNLARIDGCLPEAVRRLTEVLTRKSNRHDGLGGIDRDLIIVGVLVALGIPRGEAHNWVKGIPL